LERRLVAEAAAGRARGGGLPRVGVYCGVGDLVAGDLGGGPFQGRAEVVGVELIRLVVALPESAGVNEAGRRNWYSGRL
jgi:hypothetical protein